MTTDLFQQQLQSNRSPPNSDWWDTLSVKYWTAIVGDKGIDDSRNYSFITTRAIPRTDSCHDRKLGGLVADYRTAE